MVQIRHWPTICRRGFIIRLKRVKPRAPDFGGPKILGVRTISSISVSIIFVFLSPGCRSKGGKNHMEGSTFLNSILDVCTNRGPKMIWGLDTTGPHWRLP